MNLSLQSQAGRMPLPRWQRRCPSPTGPRIGATAFSLVELLVVIMIIVILATLMVPVVSGMVGSANSVKCVSNLKQIGAGMALYTGDHDGHLPGPLSGGQYASYFSISPGNGRLAMQLQGYISPDIPSGGGTMLSPTFACPGFAKVMKIDTTSLPYVMNNGSVNGTNPFGSGAGSTNYTEGTSVGRLSGGKPLSEIWAMRDLDQDAAGFAWGTNQAPAHPVHAVYKPVQHGSGITNVVQAHPNNYRNALFLDFHVGRLNLDDTPK